MILLSITLFYSFGALFTIIVLHEAEYDNDYEELSASALSHSAKLKSLIRKIAFKYHSFKIFFKLITCFSLCTISIFKIFAFSWPV